MKTQTLRSVVDPNEEEALFPWSLVDEVFDLIEERDARVLRYCDLDTERSLCGSRLRYFDEFVRFGLGKFGPVSALRTLTRYAVLRGGNRWPILGRLRGMYTKGDRAPTIILQHDADRFPDRTVAMAQREESRGLKSSCYVFVEHAEKDEAYELDVESLQELERRGFEIGYHQNAFERADYDQRRAFELVASDLDWLEKRFDIRSFVPHGGTPSPSGLNNDHLPQGGRLEPLLWAYNGKCILKEYTWSDGGIHKWTPMDPRRFVRELAPGSRAMMLLHPQYYGDRLRHDWEKLPISREPWWRRLWGLDT